MRWLLRNVQFRFFTLAILPIAVSIYTFTQVEAFLHIQHWIGYYLSVLLLVVFFVYVKYSYRSSKPSRLLSWPLITLNIILALLLSLELTFSYFEKCQSAGYSLAAQKWFRTHWKDNNSGYRDIDWSSPEFQNRRKIIVVGDSFVAGHGTADPNDRFSNQLEKLIGNNWKVVNLGRNGADSPTEFKNLSKIPFKVEMLVLSYFGNDIMETALTLGYTTKNLITPYEDIAQWMRYFAQRSYFLNYVYWSKARPDLKNWWDIYEQIYRDTKVLAAHKEDLMKFIDWSKAQNIPMRVVLFPYLHDMKRSSIYTDWVKGFFASQNVPVTEVASVIGDLPTSDLVVNENDIHPSVAVNHRVGKKLYEDILKDGFLSSSLPK